MWKLVTLLWCLAGCDRFSRADQPSVAQASTGTLEFCNGLDDDRDGQIDEDAVDLSTFYADADDDGFGDPATVSKLCSRPPGSSLSRLDNDCDDSNSAVHPGAWESCDGVDNNCDGLVDNNKACIAK